MIQGWVTSLLPQGCCCAIAELVENRFIRAFFRHQALA